MKFQYFFVVLVIMFLKQLDVVYGVSIGTSADIKVTDKTKTEQSPDRKPVESNSQRQQHNTINIRERRGYSKCVRKCVNPTCYLIPGGPGANNTCFAGCESKCAIKKIP
eukprot:Pgem_evm1s16093